MKHTTHQQAAGQTCTTGFCWKFCEKKPNVLMSVHRPFSETCLAAPLMTSINMDPPRRPRPRTCSIDLAYNTLRTRAEPDQPAVTLSIKIIDTGSVTPKWLFGSSRIRPVRRLRRGSQNGCKGHGCTLSARILNKVSQSVDLTSSC